ncbi:MAG TPA: nucleotidyltransferase domain-containing protein [Candidatus Binatia bacterium]|nr:nucleotidyltransferase domain-containing protein [Candidatus Binatia bacterium]
MNVPTDVEMNQRDQIPMTTSALNRLRKENAARWPNIAAAESLSREKMATLKGVVSDLLPTDEGSLVVLGSLARGEFTVDSDLDWMILIDSRADSRHLEIVHALKLGLEKAGFKVPGPTEVFGGLVFSHELVHAIGGDEDTNKNMTRRLLLLLESAAIDAPGSKEVHARVISGILNRYVEEDASFVNANKRSDKIPRFLLNDVVRFWRTMAVDYVNKYRARAGNKWALRNIKLRMSRKLLFISGFHMCISWALKAQHDEQFVVPKLVSHLRDWTQRSPLESLANVVEQYAAPLTDDIFDSYDSFLLLLNDENKRKILEKLSPEEAYTNDVFLEARVVANKFNDALTRLLFESNGDITRLTKKYGVF